ncbi:YhgE/Pip-like protein [Lysinibacillus sp. RC46]|uniref:YhgE/Pip domain-containing protein n=1 Tax=Lysinibacillus sp. RC46 TaxID=3156295 RepID=UPI003514D3CD
MKENKFFGIAFVAVLLLSFIFVATQIPGAHSSPKDLPIGLVLEDEGNMGQTFVEMIQKNSQATKESPFKWAVLKNEQEMKEKLANQELYGAIYIPIDFSEKYASFQSPTPTSAMLKIYINQGKNANVATMVTQALSTMVEKMNDNVSAQLLAITKKNNIPLNANQARTYSTPIQSEIVNVHETGKLSNAPLSFFQPIWMSSLISAILLWFTGRNRKFNSVLEQLKFRGFQALIAMIIGLFGGYLLTWYSTWMLDYEFADFHHVALFLSLTCATFILLILAITTWIQFASLPIFVLLMFFGLPLLQIAPEMLPSFYADWIYPWLPFRFMFEGLKEILFFSGKLWSSAAVTLCWMAVVSILVLLLSVVKRSSYIEEDVSAEGLSSDMKEREV